MRTNGEVMEYKAHLLETTRPSNLTDKKILEEIQLVLKGGMDHDISDRVYQDFKDEMEEYVFNSKLNNFSGHKNFYRKDIIVGCTQFIDNLYMQGDIQAFADDYRYHTRLDNKNLIKDYKDLKYDTPLIISLPYPRLGDQRSDMQEILDEALNRNIPVHIDGAWITCSKDINFDFDHPAIYSFGISLSKGLGLGWNRVGVRWHRYEHVKDSISIMNDFRMNLRAVVKIGLHFIRKFPTDYLWNTHSNRYKKVCRDFNLIETNSIHIAMLNDDPVGVSKLINYLEEHEG